VKLVILRVCGIHIKIIRNQRKPYSNLEQVQQDYGYKINAQNQLLHVINKQFGMK
jgi:hypothetical protein